MADDPKQEEQKPDLSELTSLQFATAWTPSSNSAQRDFPPRRERGFDNRKPKFSQQKRDGENKKDRRNAGDGKKGKRIKHDKKPPFNFSMEVLFYPDDAPIDKLAKVMKASMRTYQLFDIAQLVLEKPERFVILAKNLPDKEGNTAPLYCAQPYNLPFEDEQSAKSAAVKFLVDEKFEKVQQECEPPKGNFQIVNRSKITGDLLGAPNWHKYNEYLHEYHREKCPQIPFEKFASEVEGVRDADEISKWVEQMKVRTVYKLKEPGEGENSIFETREAAMNHVAHKWGAELVKKYDQVRFKGANLARLPFGRIRKNIEEAWHKQKRFPIVTANNLRGRLRRTGFAVYKRGTKGFAFVSAIKRKFLFEGDSLAEAPQKIFDFISANPGILADQLPYKFLGMEAPKSESKPKPLSEEAGSDNIENTGEPPSHPEELSDETKAKLAAVWRELAWLISEGYVVEYADASLQANPYLAKPKDKTTDAAKIEPEAESDEPVLDQKSETAVQEAAEKTDGDSEKIIEAAAATPADPQESETPEDETPEDESSDEKSKEE